MASAVINKSNQTVLDTDIITFTNRSFLLFLVLGLVTFYSLQQRGERAHSIYVTGSASKRKKVTKELLGTYYQSILHAVIISVCCFLVIFKFRNHIDELKNMSEEHPDYIFVQFYKISSVLSVAYFFMLIPYELYGINQSTITRIIMFVHHVLAVLCQSLMFLGNPLIVYTSAMILQCEFSSIFLNLRMCGIVLDRQDLVWYGGLLTLIFYPFTRCVILPIGMYITYVHMDDIIQVAGYQAFCAAVLSEVFVFIMSCGYSFILLRNPRKVMLLRKTKGD